MGQGNMNPPHAVRVATERTPRDRPQNVPLDVTPAAVQDFSYYVMAQTTGLRSRYLSVWGWPWWHSEPMTGYGSGAYGAGPYGTAANAGEYGALRYGRGKYGTGGYA